MHSLVIRNARIVDGEGGPAFLGDIGIDGDRISAVGARVGEGAHEIDAHGKVAAPGFIDIHTHYDPQLCWDRNATPTPEHGVTTLVIGNCSISLAPVRERDRARAVHLFGSVEDMEGELLKATVPFSWESAPDYLAYLRGGLGPNVAALIGHSMIRVYVMGGDAQERVATEREIAEMAALLREAMRAGAHGISFTFNHLDEMGRPLPCHYADRNEKRALLQVLAEEGRGVCEVAPDFFTRKLGIECLDEWGELALETGATCSLSPILVMPNLPGGWRTVLERLEYWQARGAPLYAQTQVRPLDMTVQLSQGSAVLSKSPAWRESFDLPLTERIKFYADPDKRARLIAEGAKLKSAILPLFVKRGHSAATRAYQGRKVAEIAESEGKDFFEVLIGLAQQDELQTEFGLEGFLHFEEDSVAELLKHPGVHIGSGDAGAHITQFAGAGDTCYLFERFVRDRGDLSVEDAVKRLTSDLADRWGFTDRGRLAPGKFADVVIFDPATIARGEEEWVEDVPGGNGRYVRHPSGVDHVIVNGEVLVEGGAYRDTQPGRLL